MGPALAKFFPPGPVDGEANRNLKAFLILTCLANTLFFAYAFFTWRYRGFYATDWFFYYELDRWADFLKVMISVENRNPYGDWQAASPPFMIFVAYLATLLRRLGLGDVRIYFLYFGGVCLAMGYVIFRLTETGLDGTGRIMVLFFTFTCYPYVYCFDRGNMVILAALAVACFLLAYDRGRYTAAAVFLGLAAALKLYPAVLGVVFLADKRFRQAAVCALTGVAATFAPLLVYRGSLVENLSIFLQNSLAYSAVGNMKIKFLVDARNSFYQLILIPKMMGGNPLTSVAEVPGFVFPFKVGLNVVMVLCVLACFFLRRNHDRVLLLTVMMIGYPIESGIYNLVLFLVPYLYWLTKERKANPVLLGLGTVLITCKSIMVAAYEPIAFSYQAVFSPVCLLAVAVYLLVLRRREVAQSIRRLRKGPGARPTPASVSE